MLLVLFGVLLEFGAPVPVVSQKSKMDAFSVVSIVSPYTFVTAQTQHTICVGKSCTIVSVLLYNDTKKQASG